MEGATCFERTGPELLRYIVKIGVRNMYVWSCLVVFCLESENHLCLQENLQLVKKFDIKEISSCC